ncbi:hypothetical protein DM02DRAFT_124290 [Periconia macrospinosa]|uniref:Zn(2)-C6 fungal-type domain-containing protein n=1 Tax=Periconia macrospinosa TaxID=97972 RepID=A0A2V1DE66_9PLEO|nr:hypothetical protein DM02DRAFT_124290 [Periconia macrospinosa]
MVYRGKPSAACGECRKKRSRCDQAIPSCGQCIRTKRKCPGYRNAMDLMFFDQTQEAAQKSKQGSQSSSRSRTLTPLAQQTIEKAVSQQALRNVAICQSLDDLAVNYFMRIYVGSNPDPAQLGFVADIYNRDGRNALELQQSLKAVGLAGYAKVSQNPDLLMTATGSYVAAVGAINHKLSTARLEADNALLTSIVLLAMFEIMVLPTDEGYRNFRRHIQGAESISCMLLKQKKYVDRKILQTIMFCMIGESWVGNRSLPPEFFTLYHELGPKTQPDSIFGLMMDILIMNMTFRHAIESGDISDPLEIVEGGLKINHRTREFFSSPSLSRYDNLYMPASDPFQDTSFSDHETHFRVHCWNNIRLCWLHLHRLLANTCTRIISSGVDADNTFVHTPEGKPISIAAQYAASSAAVVRVAREMCASLPAIGKHDKLVANFDSFDAGQIGNFPITKGRAFPLRMDVPASILLIASPRASSLFVITYQLTNLCNIHELPKDLMDWMHGHLDEIRAIDDPDDTRFLHTMLLRQRLDQASPATSPGIMIKSMLS